MSINIDQKREDCVNLKNINTIIEDFINNEDLNKRIKKYLFKDGAISEEKLVNSKKEYVFDILTKMYFIVNIDDTDIKLQTLNNCKQRINMLDSVYNSEIGKVIKFLCNNNEFYKSIRENDAFNGFNKVYSDLLSYALYEYNDDAEHNNVQFNTLKDCPYNVNQHKTNNDILSDIAKNVFTNIFA